MLKVGIVGCGDIAHIHLQAIQKLNVQVIAICDTDKSRATFIKDVPFYESIEELLEKEDLDVVHLCVPHDLHVPLAIKCIEANVHVFMEKPVGTSYEDAKVLLEANENNPEVKVGVCFQNRYNESVEYLKNHLQNNDYGKLLGLKGIVLWSRTQEYYDAKPWRGQKNRAGGGAMINQSIHTLDLLQCFGGEVESVNATVSNNTQMEIEVEDTASANIKFVNGAIANYYTTNSFALNTAVEFGLYFEKATFVIQESKLYKLEDQPIFLCEDAKVEGTKFYYGASHKKCIHAFYEAIQKDTNDYVSVAEGIKSLQLIDAIQASSKNRERVSYKEEH